MPDMTTETDVCWVRRPEDASGPSNVASLMVPRISRAVPRLRRLLGGRVQRVRRARGLSVATLAGAAGVSVRFLSRFEEGHAAISIDTLHRVAEALGVPVSLLLQLDLDRPPGRSRLAPPRLLDPATRRGVVRAIAGAAASRRGESARTRP